MIVTLIKLNRKTTDVVSLEVEGSLMRKKEGKLGKPFSFSSTLNCGTNTDANNELQKLIKEYELKGYRVQNEKVDLIEFEVFDKAKWHLENDFPVELNHYQAYIHTGFYIGWLMEKKLISAELREECKKAINDFLERKITSPKFYEEQLDGVFTTNDVNDKGYRFTKAYFDFEKGSYLNDYEKELAGDLPTIFHVEDTDENYLKMFKVIEDRFAAWDKLNN